MTDQWIRAEINLPKEDLIQKEKVIGRTKDGNGDATGSHDSNPFNNTFNYEVEFSDDKVIEHSYNVIADNIHSQVDEDGRNIQILDSIVDCRKDRNTVDNTDAHLRVKSGQQRLRHITSG